MSTVFLFLFFYEQDKRLQEEQYRSFSAVDKQLTFIFTADGLFFNSLSKVTSEKYHLSLYEPSALVFKAVLDEDANEYDWVQKFSSVVQLYVMMNISLTLLLLLPSYFYVQ